MPISTEALDQTLAKLDHAACVNFFKDVSEKDRKELSERALQWYDVSRLHHEPQLRWWVGAMISQAPKNVQKLWKELEAAKQVAKTMPSQATKEEAIAVAQLAVMATSTLTEIKKRKRIPTSQHCYDILAARRPKWLPEFCDWILEERPNVHWNLVHRLETEGLLEPNVNSNYLGALLISVDIDSLRSSQMLQDRMWSMFEDDSTMRTLMMQNPFPTGRDAWTQDSQDLWTMRNNVPQKWTTLFLSLCPDGTLDRVRLINALTDVFVRFNLEHSDSKSTLVETRYQELHDSLNLTEGERASLIPQYMRLLTCRNPKVVAWSLKSIGALVQHPEFPAEAVIDSVQVVFLMKGKDHSVEALKLLKDIADKNKDLLRPVAFATAEALSSESQDIQKRALVQLEKLKYRDDDLCQLVADKSESIGVVHRDRALAWAGKSNTPTAISDGEPEVESNVVSLRPNTPRQETQAPRTIPEQFRDLLGGDPLTALSFRGDEFPRCLPGNELPVLNSLDDLIFMCSEILHGKWNERFSSDDLDILADGVARFGCERPSDYADRTAAIRKEIEQRAPFAWNDAVNAGLSAWMGKLPLQSIAQHVDFSVSIEDELRRRLVDVGEKANKGQATVLFSTPTHKGGWIDPEVLVERVCESYAPQTGSGVKKLFGDVLSAFGVNIDRQALADQCLALLRIAPERRAQALAKLDSGNSNRTEFIDALRYALGAEGVKIGDSTPLWIAAARARNPFSNDEIVGAKHRDAGPDGTMLASYSPNYLTSIPSYALNPTRQLAMKSESDFRFVLRSPAMPPDAKLAQAFSVLRHRFKIESYSVARFTDWRRSVWPMNLDAFFAEGIDRMTTHEGSDPTGRENKVFIEPLYDPDVPVRDVGVLMLVIAATSKQKDEHEHAIEALIAVLEDGRVVGRTLGVLMRELLQTQPLRCKVGYWQHDMWPLLVSVTRWAKAFKPVLGASSYHALMIQEALEEALQGDAKKAPKDINQLLEVFLEALMETGDEVTNESTRQFLTAVHSAQPNTKGGKLAKQILALKRGAKYEAKRAEIMQYAHAKRCDRGERWATALADETRCARLVPTID
jgi:hypothetical protein